MDVFKLRATLGLDSSQYESGLEKAKGALKVVGTAIGAATTAVGAFAASAIKVGSSFDSSMSQVAATMGVTTDEIGELREFAMDMGAKTAFSATQAADALNYMALAGYDANESMEMLPNVLNLAAAGNMDLAQASDMVTDAQSALGLEMKDMEGFVDQLAKTSSKSNTSVAQLGEAILTVGGTAKSLAGGTTELNTALGILADNGIKGAEGGTHLRNVILSLSSPTDKAAGQLEDLGVVTQDAAGNLLPLEDIMGQLSQSLDGLGTAERAEVISKIFNKTDIAAVNALIDTNAERYEELSTAIDGAWYSEQSLSNQLASVGMDLEQSRAGLEKYGITTEEFDTALAKSKGDAQDFVKQLTSMANEGTTSNQILEDMGVTVSDLYHAFDRATGSAEQMAETQLDNLAGDVKLWQSALEGAQLLLSGALAPELQNFVAFGTEGLTRISDAFKSDGLSGAMEAFKEVLSDGVGMIIERVPEFVDAGLELLSALGSGLIDNVPVIFDALVQIGEMIGERILGVMEDASKYLEEFDFAGAVNNIIQYIQNAFRGGNLGRFLEVGLNILSTIAQGMIDSLPVMLDSAANMIQNFVDGISQKLPTLIPAGIKMVTEITKSLTNPTMLTKLVQAAVTLVVSLGQGLINAIPELLQAVPEIIANLVGAIVAAVPQLISAAVQLMAGLVWGLASAMPQLISFIPSIGSAIVDGIMAGLQAIKDTGEQLINGFKQGISSAWEGAKEGLLKLFEGLITKVKSLFGIHSPSTIFSDIGKDLIQGLINGIDSMMSWLKQKAQDIVDAFKDLPNKIKEIGKNIVDGLKQGISDAWSGLVDWLKEKLKGLPVIGEKILEINSPSKKFARIGESIDEGLVVGIERDMGDVEKAVSDLSNVASNADISNNVTTVGTNSGFVTAQATNIQRQPLDETDLVNAFVKALDRYGLTVQLDNRELGRVVRKEVLV